MGKTDFSVLPIPDSLEVRKQLLLLAPRRENRAAVDPRHIRTFQRQFRTILAYLS